MFKVAGIKGSWIIKALGLITCIGILIAVIAIVIKVFNEDDGAGSDSPSGI